MSTSMSKILKRSAISSRVQVVEVVATSAKNVRLARSAGVVALIVGMMSGSGAIGTVLICSIHPLGSMAQHSQTVLSPVLQHPHTLNSGAHSTLLKPSILNDSDSDSIVDKSAQTGKFGETTECKLFLRATDATVVSIVLI